LDTCVHIGFIVGADVDEVVVLSRAPERACSPISAVPPSPAMARVTIFLEGILPFLIRTFNADPMPEATAAEFSKAT